MSRDELSEIEQLDKLGVELASAGRRARAASAPGERPDPGFAMRLRARLLRDLPTASAAIQSSERIGSVPDAVERGAAGERRLDAQAPAGEWDGRRERRDLARRPFSRPVTFGERQQSATSLPGEGREWPIHLGHSAEQLPAPETDSDAHSVVALRPQVRSRVPTIARPRWAGAFAAVAAVVALAFFGGPTILWPSLATAQAGDARLATLVREGTSAPLVAGMLLRQGDEVRVDGGGHATLSIGRDVLRLAGNSAVRLDRLVAAHVVVGQLFGRVYHRVAVPDASSDYQVVTSTVTWVAHGTAFDLDREPRSDAPGERVTGLALQHAISVHGPGLELPVAQGTSATVDLKPGGAPTGTPESIPIDLATLEDPWLIGNAQLDELLGYDLGDLAAVVSPLPTESATPLATPSGAASAGPIAEPSAGPIAQPTETQPLAPTARPTPKPTPNPTPRPTATPNPTPSVGTLKVVDKGSGTYLFSWSKYTGPNFAFYKVAFGPYPNTPDYTTGSDYACALSDPAQTTCTWTPAPGKWNVRVQAIDETGGYTILSQSNIVTINVPVPATLPPTVSLGALGVAKNGDGTVTFSWTGYSGGADYSYYKLVYEPWSSGISPSYPQGSPYWAVPNPGDTSVTVDLSGADCTPGHWAVRIQAIGYPNGAYAYAQTTVYDLTLP